MVFRPGAQLPPSALVAGSAAYGPDGMARGLVWSVALRGLQGRHVGLVILVLPIGYYARCGSMATRTMADDVYYVREPRGYQSWIGPRRSPSRNPNLAAMGPRPLRKDREVAMTNFAIAAQRGQSLTQQSFDESTANERRSATPLRAQAGGGAG